MADKPQKSGKTAETAAKAPQSHISSIVSPPGSKTPPTMPSKRTMYFPDNSRNRQQPEGAEAVDPQALAKALKDYEAVGARRERTPVSSPCRKRQRVYGDRYVTLGWPGFKAAVEQHSNRMRTSVSRFATNTELASSPIATDRTSKLRTACCTKMAAPPPLPRPRNAALILNYTSRKVCPISETLDSTAD